ncbi:MAG: 4-amino-4-deoxy-L-arabinose-phospho-UDP flippase [bacterium]|nr:4-amino-4-deoxy-L-arabinose-phospho-UDP flippase [bacterium]
MTDSADQVRMPDAGGGPNAPHPVRRFLPLIGLAVVLRSAAAILAKQAAIVSVGGGVTGLVINPWLVAEVVVLGLQAIVWSAVLRRAPLTYAYPFLGLTFVINLAAARFVFGEAIRLQHMAGVGIIMAGVLVMGLETGRRASSHS